MKLIFSWYTCSCATTHSIEVYPLQIYLRLSYFYYMLLQLSWLHICVYFWYVMYIHTYLQLSFFWLIADLFLIFPHYAATSDKKHWSYFCYTCSWATSGCWCSSTAWAGWTSSPSPSSSSSQTQTSGISWSVRERKETDRQRGVQREKYRVRYIYWYDLWWFND